MLFFRGKKCRKNAGPDLGQERRISAKSSKIFVKFFEKNDDFGRLLTQVSVTKDFKFV